MVFSVCHLITMSRNLVPILKWLPRVFTNTLAMRAQVRKGNLVNLSNPLMPNSDLQILLCLTPDDFTRQRETPWALKG